MSGPLDRTVMWLTWRQLFARRRIWFAVIFSLLPVLFALIFTVVADDGNGGTARLDFFTTLNRDIIIGTLLPLAAVVLATTAFGGEVDDGTLVYLLVKPIARWRIALSKLVVAVVSTFAITIPAVLLPWLVLRGDGLPARVALAFLAGSAGGALIYCALFLWLGLAIRRALVVGLLYVILYEGVLTRGLAGLKSMCVREFAVAMAQAASAGTLTPPPYLVPMPRVWGLGTFIVLAATAWTMWRLSRYELAERL